MHKLATYVKTTKTRANIAASILQNADILESAYESSMQADGSAMKENEKYLDSIEGRINQFKNAGQEAITSIVDSGMVKDLISNATELLKILTEIIQAVKELPFGIEAIGSAFLGSFSVAKNYKNGNVGFWTDFFNSKKGIQEMSMSKETAASYIEMFKQADFTVDKLKESGNFGARIADLINAKEIDKATVSVDQLVEKVGSVAVAAPKATDGLKAFGKGVVNIGKSVLATMATAAAITALTLIISKIIQLIDEAHDSMSELNNRVESIKNSFNETQATISSHRNTIDNLQSEYEKLSSGVDSFGNNISLSEDSFKEYQSICDEIANMYPNLVAGYDAQGNAILTLKGNVDQLTQSFEEETKAAYKSAFYGFDDNKGAQDVFDAYNKSQRTDPIDVLRDLFTFFDGTQEGGYYSTQELFNFEKQILDNFGGRNFDETAQGKLVNFINTVQQSGAMPNYNGELMKYFKQKGIIDSAGKKWNESDYNEIINALVSDYDRLQTDLKQKISDLRWIGEISIHLAPDYDALNSDMQNVASMIVNNLPDNVISQIKDPLDMKLYADDIVTRLQNLTPTMQEQFGEIFSADAFDIPMNEAIGKFSDFANEISGTFSEDEIYSIEQALGVDKIRSTQRKLRNFLGNVKTDTKQLQNALRNLTRDGVERFLTEAAGITDVIRLMGILNGVVDDINADTAKASFNEFTTEVQKSMEALANLNSILSSSFDGNGLTISFDESGNVTGEYGELLNLIKTLPNADEYNLDELFINTANGIRLDTGAFRELKAELNQLQIDNISAQIKDLNSQLLQARHAGNDALVSELETEIQTLDMLSAAFRGNNSAYQEWLAAQSGGDAGDMYDSIVSTGLKSAKESYEKGETGNADFREFVELMTGKDLSNAYNGEVAEAYEEALPMIERYFTETNEGATNFILDMEKAGDVIREVGKNGKESFKFIDDMSSEKIAEDLGISVELAEILLGKLEDHEWKIDWLNEDKLEKFNESLETYNDELERFKELNGDINQTQFGNIDTNKRQRLEWTQENIDKYRKELESWGEENPDDLLGSYSTVMGSSGEYDGVEIAFSPMLQTENGPVLLSSGTVDKYINGLITEAGKDGNGWTNEELFSLDAEGLEVDGQHIQGLLADIGETAERTGELMHFTGEDGALNEYSKKLYEAGEAAGYTKEEIDELVKSLGKTGETEPPKELHEQINDAANELEKYRIYDDDMSTIGFDVKAEGFDEALDKMVKLSAEKNALSATPFIMNLDTTGLDSGVADAITKLQEYQTAVGELQALQQINKTLPDGAKLDTSEAIANVQALAQQLNEIPPEIKTTLGITEGSDFQASIDNLIELAGNPEVDADLVLKATTPVTEQINTITGETIEPLDVVIKTNADEVKKDLKDIENQDINDKSFSIDATGNAESTLNRLEQRPNIHKYVYIHTEKDNDVNGTAHMTRFADGTAHASGTALAHGNWGAPRTETALVNELGPEIIVRDGRWFTANDGKPGFTGIKKGDIIFNHKQSEELLKNGYVTKGYAHMAFAGGTAYGGLKGGGGLPKTNTAATDTAAATIQQSFVNAGKAISSASTEVKKDFKEVIDWIEILLDRADRRVEDLANKVEDTFLTYGSRQSNLTKGINAVKDEQRYASNGVKRYKKKADSITLDSKNKKRDQQLKDLIQKGKISITTIKDENLKKKIDEYRQWYEKMLDCKDKLEELQYTEKEYYKQRYELYQSQYEGILSGYENSLTILQNYIDIAEEDGHFSSSKYYTEMVKFEKKNISTLKNEKKKLTSALNEAMKNGLKVGSEEWVNMTNGIRECDIAIQESTKNILSYNNAIREIKWERWEFLQDRISDVNTELEFLYKLIDEDKMFDDKGLVTIEGMNGFALLAEQMDVYMNQAQRYQTMMDSVKADLEKDPYDTELIEKLAELRKAQQDSITSANDQKNAIRDLVKNGYDKMSESLRKIIDDYTELLDSNKDMYDYQQNVIDQQKEINRLQRQVQAWAGDNSEEGAARRQQTSTELADAQQKLYDTMEDRRISETKEALNDLYDNYTEILNSRLDDIEAVVAQVVESVNIVATGTDKVAEAVNGSSGNILDLSGVLAEASDELLGNRENIILKKIGESASYVGYNISDEVQKALGRDETISNGMRSIVSAFQNGNFIVKDAAVLDSLAGIHTFIYKEMVPALAAIAEAEAKKATTTTVKLKQGKGKTTPKTQTPKSVKSGASNGTVKKRASGGKNLRDQLAWTDEYGRNETIIRKSDGAVLTRLNLGDSVLKKMASDNLWNVANNPSDFIREHMPSMTSVSSIGGGTQNNAFDININIPNVTNYKEFVSAMKKDTQFEKLIQEMTLGQLNGNNSLKKYSINIR